MLIGIKINEETQINKLQTTKTTKVKYEKKYLFCVCHRYGVADLLR